ncbi:hypothetical protein DNTS_011897, partial [Danionella cerebrum]
SPSCRSSSTAASLLLRPRKHVRLTRGPRSLRIAVLWAQRELSASIMRVLTAAGLSLAFCSIGLTVLAISTDHWYETDARKHRERCKKYERKRNDPGYIYISNQNLPLRTRESGESGAALRETRLPAPGMESRCSRRHNSSSSGLWRRCHREGFDLENEDLIFKGVSLQETRFNSYHFLKSNHLFFSETQIKSLMVAQLENLPEEHPPIRAVESWGTAYGVGTRGKTRSKGCKLLVLCLLERCTPVKYYFSSESIPSNLQQNITQSIKEDEWHLLHLQRMTAGFMGMALSVVLFGWAVGLLGCWRLNDLMQYVSGLLFLMGGTFSIIALCTYVAGISFQLGRRPRALFALPDDISHGYSWSMFSAWSGLGLALLAGFLCTLAPALDSPPFDEPKHRAENSHSP